MSTLTSVTPLKNSGELPVLVCLGGSRITPITTKEMIVKLFLNRLTCYYGLTGSGKSYLTATILDALSDYIPKFLFYNATEKVNHTYQVMAPASTISEEFDIAKLRKDLKYQEKFFGNWMKANDLASLKLTFSRLASPVDKIEAEVAEKKLLALAETEGENDKEIRSKIDFNIIKMYKAYIDRYDDPDDLILTSLKEWMYVNPLMCTIIDDFASELESASKSKANGQEFMRALAFNLRHYGVTMGFMLQNIDALESKTRRNVHNCVFTSPSEARAYINNKTNGFSAEDKRDIPHMISKLEVLGGFRAFIYCRDIAPKYFYMIGDNITPKLCCEPLRLFNAAITTQQQIQEAEFEDC